MIEAQLKELEECMRVLCIDREDWLAYLLKGKGLTIKAVNQAQFLSKSSWRTLEPDEALETLLKGKGLTVEAVKQAKSLSKSPWRTLESDEALETLLKEKGFTLEDLKSLKTSKKSEKKESKSCKVKEAPKPSEPMNWKEYPIVNPEFDEDDIWSRIKIGWYAFAGGHFSPKKDAFPDCQGVIGIINDDPKAKEGNRVKVVLRHQKDMIEWCKIHIYTGVTDDDDGRENTRRLLEFGKKKGVSFPAMEFAHDYNYDGVKVGTAYVPAINELQELSKNYEVIDDALRQIGSRFHGCYWSSTEDSTDRAWNDGYVGGYDKYNSGAVSCLLAY